MKAFAKLGHALCWSVVVWGFLKTFLNFLHSVQVCLTPLLQVPHSCVSSLHVCLLRYDNFKHFF